MAKVFDFALSAVVGTILTAALLSAFAGAVYYAFSVAFYYFGNSPLGVLDAGIAITSCGLGISFAAHHAEDKT